MYKLQKHTGALPAHSQMRDDLENALIYDWAIICPLAIRKLIRSFTCLCTIVFDTRGGRMLYLLNFVCDLKHVTVLFVKLSCPIHWYANVQISVVTKPFDFSCVYHCNVLLIFLKIVNYIYTCIVLPIINGFLCKTKINEIVLNFHFVVLTLFWGVYIYSSIFEFTVAFPQGNLFLLILIWASVTLTSQLYLPRVFFSCFFPPTVTVIFELYVYAFTDKYLTFLLLTFIGQCYIHMYVNKDKCMVFHKIKLQPHVLRSTHLLLLCVVFIWWLQFLQCTSIT